jgi:engulfment/cell motility protein 1
MYSLTSEELTSVILDFQANMARATYRKKTTLVEPAVEPAQSQALEYVWRASRLEEARDEQGFPSRWRQLGFDGEDMGKEFGGVGLLGLHSLVRSLFKLVCGIQTKLHDRDTLLSQIQTSSPRLDHT